MIDRALDWVLVTWLLGITTSQIFHRRRDIKMLDELKQMIREIRNEIESNDELG